MDNFIWSRKDIPIADELEKLIPQLRNDFLNYHTDFYQDFGSGTPYSNPYVSVEETMSAPGAWKIEPVRYVLPDSGIEKNFDVASKYPTATMLREKFQGQCGCITYNVLEGNSFLRRHTDPENRARRFVRIHLPLIIPEGDMFLEVAGVEVPWTDIFAFDNEQLHSAYNYSPNRRLIFLIDISRELLGLPPGNRYIFENEIITKFVRGNVFKL